MPVAWPAAHSMDGDWMTGRAIGQKMVGLSDRDGGQGYRTEDVLFLHVLALLKDKAALALSIGHCPPASPTVTRVESR